MGERRAFAWVDDEITGADRTWVKEHHDGPALLHRIDPRRGLAIDDFAALTAWATGLELERMEAEGLVTARLVEQRRRPNKRLFSPTEAGREAVCAYTAEPPGRPAVIRDELLVKVQCADAGDVEAVRAAVVERMEWATAKVARYERIRQRLLGGRSEEAYFAEAERIGPYLTLLRGMSFERENLQWGDMALRRLDQRAKMITQKIE